MSPAGEMLVGVLVAIGAVVVLPLGLRLLGPSVVPAPRSVAWPLAGAAAVGSLVLPRGGAAVALAVVFAVATGVLLVAGVRHAALAVGAVTPRDRGDQDAGDGPILRLGPVAATVTALALPAVGASALVAERAGWGLLGFSGTYLALTVPHMLYAGFGAALVAGTVARLAATDALAVAGSWGVPLGTGLVLVGYFVGDVAELVGAIVLTLALWATALATVRTLVRPGTPDGGPVRVTTGARALLATGAVAVGLSMLLALWWAAGEAFGFVHPGLDVMAATHGVANAVGFVLCTLLGLRLLSRSDRDGRSRTATPPSAATRPDGPARDHERSTT